MKTTHCISYEEAETIVRGIADKLLESGRAAVIAVADPHGELIAFARMDGAPLASIAIACSKAYSAARGRKPTKDIGDKARDPVEGFDIAYFGDAKFTGFGGGIPVWRHGEVVGAVAVSALPSAEDIELATFGATLVGES